MTWCLTDGFLAYHTLGRVENGKKTPRVRMRSPVRILMFHSIKDDFVRAVGLMVMMVVEMEKSGRI